jgi:hypothetical protein
MSCIQTNILAGASGQGGGGYEIERSLRFNSADSAYLNRTPSSAGNRKTWTWSNWIKRSALSGSTRDWIFIGGNTASDTGIIFIGFKQNDDLLVGTNNTDLLLTDAVFRDLSAWMHIVVAFDTTQSTASDRLKVYVNGVEITSFSTDNRSSITQNGDYGANQAQRHTIGSVQNYGGNTPEYIDAYLADIHFIDGQALAPTDFGETDDNGVWQAKEFAGTYGTNGFHLDFADNSSNAALGTDTSGNGNTWTVNNLSVAAGAGNDSLRDSPTNGTQTDTGAGGEVVGNYATLNPLHDSQFGSNIPVLSNGNLTLSQSADRVTFLTIAVSSGKWYAEMTATTNTNQLLGITNDENTVGGVYGNTGSYYYYPAASRKYVNGSYSSYGTTISVGDTVGMALDLDSATRTLTFYKNGVSQGVLANPPADTYFIGIGTGNAAASVTEINCGQRPFAYTAPSGYKSLNTANLPEPTIADGSAYFDTKLYTGSGVARSITGYEFSPDWVWLKRRSAASNHLLFDIIRGTEKILESDTSDAEATLSGSLTAFNSDGFSLGTSSGGNNSGATWVAWAWDAGSSTVTNNDGSIASQVRANPSAGFSIVSYTGNGTAGASVGHGLSASPEFIIVKTRNTTGSGWRVYHSALGNTKYIQLDSSDKAYAYTDWNNTTPSSSVITLGASSPAPTNTNGNTYIAYCFAPVEGYSAFGSYTGNGSADGPFVYTGFRPAFLMFKRSDSTGDWIIFDNKRNTHEGNYREKVLYPNKSNAEETSADGDTMLFLSNGFKLNNVTYAYWNASGGTYIYAAFAENPFKTARAR